MVVGYGKYDLGSIFLGGKLSDFAEKIILNVCGLWTIVDGDCHGPYGLNYTTARWKVQAE